MNGIGVIVDSFGLGLYEGIKKAKEIGAEGIQLYAVKGEMAPENLDAKGRKDLVDYIHSQGLVVTALCGDLGGHGFTRRGDNRAKIERSKSIMDLALDLGTKVVTTHIGVIPENKDHERYKVLKEACLELGRYGEAVGACFAIETGPEKATTLYEFLEELDCHGIGVNYDPANLVMVTGDNPVQGVHTLRKYIVHTHAKDGIRLQEVNPEFIYNCFAEQNPENFHLEACFKEVPLGQGHVNFEEYLKALQDIGYKGFLTIEREVGDNPVRDIQGAVTFLKSFR